MSIKKFIEELAEVIEARNDGLRVVPTEMRKNNGIVQNGVSFYRKNENVAPIFWLNQFYERFKKGELLKEHILERIIREYESLPAPNIPDMEEWLSSPEFLSQISIHLVNGPRNQKMIEERNLVSYEVENTDLVCLFYAKVFLEDDTLGEVAITERIMEEYLPKVKDAEELYRLVTEQVPPEELRFESSLSVMERLFREKKIDVPPFHMVEDYMYILSNKQMTFVEARLATNKEVITKTPKTKSGNRIVQIPEILANMLRRKREEYKEKKLRGGKSFHDDGYVFCNDLGIPLHSDTIYKHHMRCMKMLQKKYPGFEYVKLHGLRHTYATIAVETGMNVKSLSSQLGHSTTAMTMNLYAHSIESAKREGANKINEVFAQKAQNF